MFLANTVIIAAQIRRRTKLSIGARKLHPLRGKACDEFRAKFSGGNAAAQSPTEKQRLFREFREWSQGEGKK
jgi:hypothetical protein